MCAEVVAVTRRRTGVRVQAGIGAAAEGLAGVPASRAEADRVLAAMPADADVAAFDDLRAEVLLGQTLAVLRERPDLRDPAVDALVAYDRAHGGDLAGSVLAWLDALGDVRAAAAHAHRAPQHAALPGAPGRRGGRAAARRPPRAARAPPRTCMPPAPIGLSRHLAHRTTRPRFAVPDDESATAAAFLG